MALLDDGPAKRKVRVRGIPVQRAGQGRPARYAAALSHGGVIARQPCCLIRTHDARCGAQVTECATAPGPLPPSAAWAVPFQKAHWC